MNHIAGEYRFFVTELVCHSQTEHLLTGKKSYRFNPTLVEVDMFCEMFC